MVTIAKKTEKMLFIYEKKQTVRAGYQHENTDITTVLSAKSDSDVMFCLQI